jgi:nucleotide-binding universal stress UspA family protein
VKVLAARGSADARLVTLSDQESFDLVVVGQRRQSVVEELWYGSVARGVLRASPVSVACVPPPLGGASPVFRPPRVVLVGTDLDAVGDVALANAIGLAAGGAVVHVAHVVPSAATPEESRRSREQAWFALSRLAAPVIGPERPVGIERHFLEGAPSEQLLQLAMRIGADLIVLGMRGRGAASRALLGSVARTVSEEAGVPVLLVPQASV